MKDQKKVLFVATVASHIRGFHEPYLKLFQENGYKTYVAAKNNLKENESINHCDKFIEISIERSPFKLSNLKAIKELKQIINDEKFDIIHCHTPMGAVVARLASSKARKKYKTRVIYTAHGFHFFNGAPLKNWLMFYPVEWYLSKKTDTIITINNEDFELAKKRFSKRCHDIQYIPGVGIDIEKFNINLIDKEKKVLKKSLGLKESDFVLTCVARLDKNKNQGFLIDVMEKLVKNHKNIHLLLAGRDELDGVYQKKVDEKKLSNNVHFLGNVDDVPKLLSITDIIVSASKREGLPVNVLEAMASKKPVVALNCRGMKDLILDGKNGFIVNNEDDFVEKVLGIYNKKYIIRSDMDYVDKFSIENVLNLIKNCYNLSTSDNILNNCNSISKTRVLHLLNTNRFSGAENVVCTIIKKFEDKYDMFYCSPNGTIAEKMTNDKIDYYPINRLSILEVKKAIKVIKPDIIHAHDNRATVIASFFAKKVKVISHIHGNNKIMNNLNLKTLLFDFCSKRIKKIIWVSDSSYDNYYFKKKIIDKSTVLYNVIDENDIIKKSKLGKCGKKYDLIFLGRLGYPKNPKRLIEIINSLKSKKKDISIAIVGDGEDREMVQQLICDYKLENNIKLYGFQSNPYPILEKSKVLIMTSIYEGTPMCALEAQALGKPIVATPVDGLKKIVINNKNGYLSDSNEELCDYILKILKDEKQYNKTSDNSKIMFKKFNNVSKYFDTLDNIYNLK